MHANIQLKTDSILPVALVLAWQSGAADRLWIIHMLNLHKVLLQVHHQALLQELLSWFEETDAYITGTWSPTPLKLNLSSFNLGSLLMPERDVEDDQTIFLSLGADPLVKTIFVMAEQSTTRRLSHKNSSFFNVILF
uniref:Uncharacterized protein n=1 Tax=Triticum urartu TaxID=4572 RepID=A0A8R7U140_TRIUA